MAKLTLSVDDSVISRAKRYAKAHGVSISKMVEAYLAAVARANDSRALRYADSSFRKSTDVKDYKRYLATKYR
jgi:hypothetical protein